VGFLGRPGPLLTGAEEGEGAGAGAREGAVAGAGAGAGVSFFGRPRPLLTGVDAGVMEGAGMGAGGVVPCPKYIHHDFVIQQDGQNCMKGWVLTCKVSRSCPMNLD